MVAFGAKPLVVKQRLVAPIECVYTTYFESISLCIEVVFGSQFLYGLAGGSYQFKALVQCSVCGTCNRRTDYMCMQLHPCFRESIIRQDAHIRHMFQYIAGKN